MAAIKESWSQLTPETSQVMICDLQEQIVVRSKTTTPDALSQSAEVLCQSWETASSVVRRQLKVLDSVSCYEQGYLVVSSDLHILKLPFHHPLQVVEFVGHVMENSLVVI
jgi:hypothetical protein